MNKKEEEFAIILLAGVLFLSFILFLNPVINSFTVYDGEGNSEGVEDSSQEFSAEGEDKDEDKDKDKDKDNEEPEEPPEPEEPEEQPEGLPEESAEPEEEPAEEQPAEEQPDELPESPAEPEETAEPAAIEVSSASSNSGAGISGGSRSFKGTTITSTATAINANTEVSTNTESADMGIKSQTKEEAGETKVYEEVKSSNGLEAEKQELGIIREIPKKNIKFNLKSIIGLMGLLFAICSCFFIKKNILRKNDFKFIVITKIRKIFK